MTTPIRVLAVIEASTVTGPAKNLIEFSRVAGSKVELTVATFHRGAKENEFVEAARAAGITIEVIPERSAFDSQVIARLRSLVTRLDPAILQTHAVKSHFLMRLSGRWKRRPWIAFHHGYTAADLKMRVYNQLDRWSLRAPALLVTVSEAYRRQLIALVGRSKINVLHNAIDAAWAERVRSVERAAFRAKLRISPEAKVILAIGRMSREKAHADLISAFQRLRSAQPGLDLTLLLVGDGPERRRLEAMGGGMLFTGQVRDVSPFYAIADLLVLPSLVEGSPNVLLEAMAAGVPVVATEVGGIPEIVRHEESALLVPPRDTVAMASQMERVLVDDRLRADLVRCARQTIETKHSQQARASALIDLYTSISLSWRTPPS